MAQRIEPRDGYLAVLFSGAVDRASVQGALEGTPGAVETIRLTRRVYFDFSGVTSFAFDPLTLGEGMTRMAQAGLRLAIASSSPEFFGVGRQIALFSGVEGVAINVFRSEADAVAWLLRVCE